MVRAVMGEALDVPRPPKHSLRRGRSRGPRPAPVASAGQQGQCAHRLNESNPLGKTSLVYSEINKMNKLVVK